MFPGTFGCPIRAVGYATSVTLSSRYLTAGTTVDFVAEFSAPSVQRTLFLLCPMSPGVPGLDVKIARGSGSVVIATNSGIRGQQRLTMGLLHNPAVPALGLVHHHRQQAWPAQSPAAPAKVALALLSPHLTRLVRTSMFHLVLVLALINLPKWIWLQFRKGT